MTTPAEMDPERAVLGIAMESRDAITDMPLTVEDFADLRHGALWDLITRMDRDGRPTTPVAIAQALPEIPDDLRRGIDGPWLFECWQAHPITAAGHHYARIVADQAARRRLSAALDRGRQLLETTENPATIADLIRGELDTTDTTNHTARFIGHTLDGTIDAFDQATTAVPTPWPDLNHKITGWAPGRLYVIGARPGVGKSIVGLQAALGLAHHGPVAFHSLEMTTDEVNARAIAQIGEVALGRLEGRSDTADPLTERDWNHIAQARATLDNLPLSIDDNPAAGLPEIRAHARRLTRHGKVAGIVVDYLQLMATPRGDKRSRYEIVGEFSRGLKLAAKEFDCPVIALSQLNRGSENRPDKRPTLADLRESGAIEQDSSVVLLLHVDDDRPDELDMAVAKNRHGVRGPVSLTRQGHYARLVPRQWRPRIAPPPAYPAYADN